MAPLRPPFSGGIRLPPPDERTRAQPTRQMDFAPVLTVPLDRPAAAAGIVVRESDAVERGQLLAGAADDDSVPVHAPASGRIQRIEMRPAGGGATTCVIHLATFPGSTQECRVGRACEIDTADPDAIVAAIRAAGIAGADASGAPLHRRLHAFREPPLRLLVHGIAGDALLGRPHRILRDQAPALLLGVRYLLRACGTGQALLAVEAHDEEAARTALGAATGGPALELRVLPARYPQGAGPLFIATVLGDPSLVGCDPIEAGVLCVDIATVAEIGRLLPIGQPSTDVLLSLAGGGLDDPGTWRVPLGTPLRFALERAGLRPDSRRVLAGGPLRGNALASLAVPITAEAEGFVVLTPEEIGDPGSVQPCIRCGDCLDVCPVQLNPAEMGAYARKGEWTQLQQRHDIDRCFECGCCAYVCPSRIPLVQLFRTAKARRDRSAAAGIAV